MSGDATIPFMLRRVLWILVIGSVAFAGLLLLAAYGPDLRRARDGGSHPLSISAVGYKGLVDLIGYSGGTAALLRDEQALGTRDLLVLTPEARTDPAEIAKRVAARTNAPTLIILPKWSVKARDLHPGWVERTGTIAPDVVTALLADIAPIHVIDVPVPNTRAVQLSAVGGMTAGASTGLPMATRRLEGLGIDPLLADSKGRAVLAAVSGRQLYVLAEPDLLANHGLRNSATARSALALLANLNASGAEAIAFDLTLNGLGQTKNLLKLAFEPPFVALTLSLLGAALLAGLHGGARFGPVRRDERMLAFGKRALVDNVSALIVRAGREAATGARYASFTRDAVAGATGAPRRSGEGALTLYLDRLGGDEASYSALAEAAQTASSREELLAAARALYSWRRTYKRDG
jgi:hypothetical protein